MVRDERALLSAIQVSFQAAMTVEGKGTACQDRVALIPVGLGLVAVIADGAGGTCEVRDSTHRGPLECGGSDGLQLSLDVIEDARSTSGSSRPGANVIEDVTCAPQMSCDAPVHCSSQGRTCCCRARDALRGGCCVQGPK